MRGRKKIKKREILADLKYQSILVSKFINKVMQDGKKEVAKNIVYGAFEIIKKDGKNEPLDVFEKAIDNVRPLLEVSSKRIGGATYQVPIEVNRDRGQTLAIRWLIESTRSRKGKSMDKLLAEELANAYNKTGVAMTKRENTHKMAEANRAFAHYARF